MRKIVFVLSVISGLSLMAQRDPFSFESPHAKDIQENVVKNDDIAIKEVETANKKLVVGDKFDDEWIIKSVTEHVLILQNNKGHVREISLSPSHINK